MLVVLYVYLCIMGVVGHSCDFDFVYIQSVGDFIQWVIYSEWQ